MRRPLLLALLGLVLAGWALAGCSPANSPPVALDPRVTSTAETDPSPTSARPSASAPTVWAKSPTPTQPPAATHTPSPTTAPTATPAPTPIPTPPVPEAGEPLPFSLGWRLDSGGHLTAATPAQLRGRPAFVVTSLDGTVSALAGNGKLIWRARTSGPAYALTLVEGERVAVGDDAGQITLFDAQGGTLWHAALGSRVTALRGWLGGLLAGGWDERLTWLGADPAGPVVQWQADLGGPVSAIAALPDLALAATLTGEVHALDRTGAQAWRFDAGAPVTGLGTLDSPGGGLILVGVQDGRLLALDGGANSVQLRWELALGEGGPVWVAADLTGDPGPEVVFGTGGTRPTLGLLSTAGDLLWHVAVPSPAGAVTALDLDGDGAAEIVAGLDSGEILAFDGQGRLRSSIHAGLPLAGLTAGNEGTALALADVAAWQLVGRDGPAGGPWLPPPKMVPAASWSSPRSALTPSPTDPQPGAGEGASLVFLGDVALGRSVEAQLVRYGPAVPWAGLGPLLRQADLAVANLEGALTTQGRPLNKRYLIRAHPRWGQTLEAAGVDLVTVANNHALDFGQAGLDETLATVRDLGIASVGGGSSADPGQARRPALFTLNGVRVAVLGYAAARWNGSVDVPVTDRVAWAQVEAVQADVRTARAGADLVVVLLHAGTEYASQPSADQIAVAHAAVDAGADLVVGHHPHVTQTVERYKQGLIVYSLGDALFDIPRPAAMRGHLLRVQATQQGIAQAELWPFWIEDAIRPRLLDDGQGRPRMRVIYP